MSNKNNLNKNGHWLIFQNYRHALRPFLILIILFIFSFFIILFIDKFSVSEIMHLIQKPDSENVVSNLFANAGGELVLGLLGIVMTVVAIIVELAANRYTARVSDLFVRDRVNIIFLILMALTSINLVIILFLSRQDKIPNFLISVTVLLIVISIISLVPYFFFVFKFLEPGNIISKIENDLLKNAKKAGRINSGKKRFIRKYVDFYQDQLVQGIDQLTDIILNSIEKKDNVLATNCIKSLSNFSINYLELKKHKRFDSIWFHPSDNIRYNNADFVTLMEYSFKNMIKEKNWVEHKIFKALKTSFQESLNKARDLCNYASQCLFQIGKKAVNVNDENISSLVIKFFNTLLRATINAYDVSTCFNLLNQYRLFGEYLIETKNERLVIDIACYFKYYGHLANESKNIPFILETVAHDLCELNKFSYLNGIDTKEEILDIILTIDNPLEGEKEKTTLRGVRKAQIILAIFFLSKNSAESTLKARRIFFDILQDIDKFNEGFERIYLIIRELKYLKPEFWEIIDRGMNIDYIPDDEKQYLTTFLDWLFIRQIILYADIFNEKEENAGKVLTEFNEMIKKLPKETPIELKEFEKIYGPDGIDNQRNVCQYIIDLLDKLMDPGILAEKLSDLREILKIPSNKIDEKSLIKGVKDFEEKFRMQIKKI